MTDRTGRKKKHNERPSEKQNERQLAKRRNRLRDRAYRKEKHNDRQS